MPPPRTAAEVVALCVALALAAPACATNSGPKVAEQLPLVQPAEVADEAFAAALLDVLKDGQRSEARQKTLLGVSRRLLVHAGQRFDAGADERGLKTVLGALYLLRAGEQSHVIVDRETSRAVDAAIERLSARGDIGRTRVLFALRAPTASEAERREIDEHLEAIERFHRETLTGRPLERAGDAERTAVSMAMLSHSHMEEAMRTINDWIALGIHGNVTYQETGKRPPAEEAIEIARSLGTGAVTIVALALRHGDVQDAVQRLLQSNARRVADPQFFSALKDAEQRGDAASFRDLYDALAIEVDGSIGGETGVDADLYEAARFAVLIEAYRKQPDHAPTTLELARALVDLGMCEVVPLLVNEAISDRSTPADVVRGMRSVLSAITTDASAGDFAAAGRTIAASRPLLERAKSLLGSQGGAEAVAELRYTMATILVKGGRAEQAEGLLSEALADAPKPAGHLARARLLRQSRALERALTDVAAVVGTKGADPVDVADARLLEFEIRRDSGDRAAAEAAVSAALSVATKAVVDRKAGVQRARALGALGRVLSAYGDREGARRAFERALGAAPADRDFVSMIMLKAASAGLALGDRESLRMALQTGALAGASADSLVYGALWLTLADRQAGAPPDEAALEILDGAATRASWTGRLAAWARGKVSDETLVKKATSEAARVEAAFYVAMASRARGAPSEDALRLVAASPLYTSPEVNIARNLLAPRASFELPKNLKIP